MSIYYFYAFHTLSLLTVTQTAERYITASLFQIWNAKECSNYHTIALISHASKVMLKILQARLHQYVNCELPNVQAGFRKGRGTRDQIVKSTGSSKKQKSSRKISISALLTMPKSLTVWITINCGKFWRRWEYQTTWPASWETGQETTFRTGHATTDWFQLGKGIHQGCILSPCLFNFYAQYIMRNVGMAKA